MVDNHTDVPCPMLITHISYRYPYQCLNNIRSPVSVSHIDLPYRYQIISCHFARTALPSSSSSASLDPREPRHQLGSVSGSDHQGRFDLLHDKLVPASFFADLFRGSNGDALTVPRPYILQSAVNGRLIYTVMYRSDRLLSQGHPNPRLPLHPQPDLRSLSDT
jgi:hypothetical protein